MSTKNVDVTVGGNVVASAGFIRWIQGTGTTYTVAVDFQTDYITVTDNATVGAVATDVIWDAKGDLAVGTGADTAARLAVGARGDILAVDTSPSTGLRWVPDVLNVRAFGAVGDGATDDTAAFVAARAAGKHLFAPTGTYLVGPLAIASMQWEHWHGAGMEHTIIKCLGSGAIFSLDSGLNHSNTFEDISFQGTVAAGQRAFLAAGATTFSGHFFRCQFKNLNFSIDTNATVCETTGLRFSRCEFDNAPTRITGAAAHNTMVFDTCRWSGSAQNVPALHIENTGSTDVQVQLRGCVFESNDREAVRAWRQQSLVIDGCYFELNNTDLAASTPIVNLGGAGNQFTTFEDCYWNEAGDTIIGSSNASPQMNGVVLINPTIAGGTVDRANMPNLLELSNGGVALGSTAAAVGGRVIAPTFQVAGASPRFRSNAGASYLQLDDAGVGALLVGPAGAGVQITASDILLGMLLRATSGLKIDVVATASLPAAAAAQDGRILIEDNGAGDRNLVIYAGGQRFRIDGGVAF